MRLRPIVRLFVALIALACPLAAAAQAREADEPRWTERAEWWGDINLASYHFGDEEDFLGPGREFNERNYGVGLEVQWAPRHAGSVGYFRNSVHEDSFYAVYHYTPFAFGRFVRVGGMAGVVTGYPGFNDGGLAPAGGLIAKIEGRRVGVNLLYLPYVEDLSPHTLGLQLKIRLDDPDQ